MMAEATLESLQNLLEQIHERFGLMDQRFESIDQRFDVVERRMESGFMALNNRLDDHEELLHFITRIAMGHEEDIAEIKNLLRKFVPQTQT